MTDTIKNHSAPDKAEQVACRHHPVSMDRTLLRLAGRYVPYTHITTCGNNETAHHPLSLQAEKSRVAVEAVEALRREVEKEAQEQRRRQEEAEAQAKARGREEQKEEKVARAGDIGTDPLKVPCEESDLASEILTGEEDTRGKLQAVSVATFNKHTNSQKR